MSTAFVDDLDGYLAALVERGSPIDAHLQPGLDPAEVRRALGDVGLDAPDEAIELWSWRNGTPGGAWGGPDLFWETTDLLPVQECVQLWQELQAVADADQPGVGWREFADAGELFPGPRHFLPFLVLDVREVMFLDCGPGEHRGALWFGTSSEAPCLVFDDLVEAVHAARWCVDTGLWRIDAAGRLECDRDVVPGPGDRDHPPWRTI